MNPFAPSAAPLSVTVLVLPGSSMMTVASVLDPMRACNRISRGERIAWRAVSADGAPVELTCGLPLAGAGSARGRRGGRPLDRGRGVRRAEARRPARCWRGCAGRCRGSRRWRGSSRGLGARGGGGARRAAGDDALGGPRGVRRALSRRREVVADRYVIDGRIVTAGGASPAFDLILHLIRSRFGAAVALDVASVFVYDEAHAALGRAAAGLARPARGARAAGGGGDPADGGARSTGRWRAPRSRGGSGCRCARSRRCSAGRSASGRRPTACSSGCRRRAGW